MSKTFKHLNYEQRKEIKRLLEKGCSKTTIADSIGVSLSTIYNELFRGRYAGFYDPEFAESEYQKSQQNKKCNVPIMKAAPALASYISDLILNEHLSPEKIITLINSESNPYHSQITSPKTIYNAIDAGLLPNVTKGSLRADSCTLNGDGQIRLAKWVINEMELKDGDALSYEITEDNRLILIPKG